LLTKVFKCLFTSELSKPCHPLAARFYLQNKRCQFCYQYPTSGYSTNLLMLCYYLFFKRQLCHITLPFFLLYFLNGVLATRTIQSPSSSSKFSEKMSIVSYNSVSLFRFMSELLPTMALFIVKSQDCYVFIALHTGIHFF